MEELIIIIRWKHNWWHNSHLWSKRKFWSNW